MADLLNQFVDGPNVYKGLLNLSTLNSGLTASLQSVTDGMGNASPLQLSTTQALFTNTTRFATNFGVNNNGMSIMGFDTVYSGIYPSSDNTNTANYVLAWRNDRMQVFMSTSQFIDFYTPGSTLTLNATLMRWSTGNVVIGHTSASARLHVRGNGSNTRLETSVARRIFEADGNTGRWLGDGISYITPYDYATGFAAIASSTGFGINFVPGAATVSHSISSTGTRFNFGNGGAAIWTLTSAGGESTSGGSLYFRTGMSPSAGNGIILGVTGNFTWTSGTGNHILMDSIYAAAAGSGNFRPLALTYTINNSGAQTGNATGIFLNATETALNGMAHNLMDLQVGNSSRFRVRNDGNLFTSGNLYLALQVGRVGFSFVNFNGNGTILLNNASETDFNRLQFGGTTNAFPAIKRNGVGLQIRRADDSAYSDLEASTLLAASGIVYLNTSANVFIIRGTGSPEGVQSGGVGSLYLRTDGGSNTTLYVKESGTGNTGWVAK